MTEIRFFVPGLPAPGGSKQAFVPLNRKTGEPYRGKGGRIIVNVVDDAGKRNKAWKQEVAKAALIAMKLADLAPLTGALHLELLFQMPRPKFHFRSDGLSLRPNAPQHHITRPDCGKLARSTTDACTGIVWRDDGQIVVDHGEKAFSDQPGCWVIVKEAELET